MRAAILALALAACGAPARTVVVRLGQPCCCPDPGATVDACAAELPGMAVCGSPGHPDPYCWVGDGGVSGEVYPL